VWGSFLNVVIYRLPRGLSVVRPASHCPACEQPIRVYDNIPVLSYLLLGARARCCGVHISGRYPIVELCGGVLSVAIVEVIIRPLPLATPILHALAIYVADLALVLGLTAAAFIDLDHMEVPDSISLGGTALGLLTFSLRGMAFTDGLLGAAVGFAVVWLPFGVLYTRLRGKPGIGMGDAKLTMLAGAWFGWVGALFVLAAGALQGTLAVIVMLLAGKRPEEPETVQRWREEQLEELERLPEEERRKLEAELRLDPLATPPGEGLTQARIAFGPFLILATLELLLIGPRRILSWVLL